MAPVLALTLGGAIALGLVLMFALRRWGDAEARTEIGLRSLGAEDRLTYVVPDGQDASVVMTALATRGYVCAADSEGGEERLLVACDEQHRPQVRAIIQRATGSHAPSS
jgi:hypothetical protein